MAVAHTSTTSSVLIAAFQVNLGQLFTLGLHSPLLSKENLCGLYFCPVVSFFFFLCFFLTESQPSQIGCLPYFHTWCGPSANLECRSQMYCMRLSGNAACKKSPSGHHRTTLSDHIFPTKTHINNWKKKLFSSNISSTCPYNMVNFSLLVAQIISLVWGTPANFNGFRVLASLLQQGRSTEANQTLHNVWPLPGW